MFPIYSCPRLTNRSLSPCPSELLLRHKDTHPFLTHPHSPSTITHTPTHPHTILTHTINTPPPSYHTLTQPPKATPHTPPISTTPTLILTPHAHTPHTYILHTSPSHHHPVGTLTLTQHPYIFTPHCTPAPIHTHTTYPMSPSHAPTHPPALTHSHTTLPHIPHPLAVTHPHTTHAHNHTHKYLTLLQHSHLLYKRVTYI